MSFTPFSPVFLSIGPLSFHYYGLMYAIGFSIAYFMLPILYKQRNITLTEKQHESLFLLVALSGILGGRLFYVVFYNISYFLENPVHILAIHKGGMSSHGGFFGVFVGALVFARKYNISPLAFLDCLALPAGIGLSLGRLGNLINGELFGRITDMPFCREIEGKEGCRHPSQLYAILKDLFLFTLLFSLRKKFLHTEGVLSGIFLVLYSTIRFFLEFFREPDPQLGFVFYSFTQGQVLSVFFLLFGISLLGYSLFYKKSETV
jgi:phosphatidylglycerol:prolipoprotein diacylglycerol transferase